MIVGIAVKHRDSEYALVEDHLRILMWFVTVFSAFMFTNQPLTWYVRGAPQKDIIRMCAFFTLQKFKY